ncbi:MAG: hypothetical protein AAF125_02795, partial [Chloroflexota bacterium]
MWNNIAVRIMNLTPYEGRRTQYNRALIAYTAIYLSFALFTLYAALVPIQGTGTVGLSTIFERAISPANNNWVYTVSVLGFYITGIIALRMLWMGRLAQVRYLPSVMLYLGIGGIGVTNNLAFSQNAYLLIPPILLGGIMDGDRGILILTPVHFLTLMVGYTIYIESDVQNTFSSLVALVMISIVFIGLLYLYLRTASDVTGELEESLIRQRLKI